MITKLLGSHSDVKTILASAYAKNQSSDYLAISLSRNISNDGDLAGSIELLRSAISKTPTSKPLQLALAKELIASNDASLHEEILHHLQRSFSPNDTNYDAQFWFARQHYIYGNREVAQKTFDALKSNRLPPFLRNRVSGQIVDAQGNKVIYNGKIASEHVNFYFVKCSELRDVVYANVKDFGGTSDVSDASIFGKEVSFSLTFTVLGPRATDLDII